MNQSTHDLESFLKPRNPVYPDGQSMHIALKKVLSPKLKIQCEHDFGFTTKLELKVVDVREGSAAEKPLHVVAQNEEPSIPRDECHSRPSKWTCYWNEPTWPCENCIAENEECLPVVNSPRVRGLFSYPSSLNEHFQRRIRCLNITRDK